MRFLSFLLLSMLASFSFAQPAGNLDPSFGTGGKVITAIPNGQSQAHSVALQPDGKIIVAGFYGSPITGKDFLCIRYHADGTPDSTFGVAGRVSTDLQLGSDDVAHSLALQPDGKIVLAGFSDDGADKNAAIVRYKIDGSLDSTFGVNGIQLTDFDNNHQDEINVVKVHALTGKIIVGGLSIISSSVSKPVVARYLSNGDLDTTFNSTGIRLLWITSLDYQYYFSLEDLAVQTNGKITGVGWRDFPGLSWDSDYWACRINSDGSMDNTFSSDGVNVYNGSFNGHDRAFAMQLLSSGNFLMAGGGYLTTLAYDYTLVEINVNGSVGSLSATSDFGSNDIAFGLGQDSNGKIVLAGTSGSSTNSKFALSRYSVSGGIDNSFGSSGKTTTTFISNGINECKAMVIQPDNKIVAVGFAGNDIALARYLGTGQVDLDNFQLALPANNAINQPYQSLSLDWTDAFLATGYEIQLDTNVTFTGNPQNFTSIGSIKPVTNLLPLTSYYWRVRATDGTNFGQWVGPRKFTTTFAVALDPFISAASIQVFPNPVTDQMIIRNTANYAGTSFSVMDVQGKTLLSGTLSGTETTLQMENLPAGIYLLRLDTPNQEVVKVTKR